MTGGEEEQEAEEEEMGEEEDSLAFFQCSTHGNKTMSKSTGTGLIALEPSTRWLEG